MDETEVLKTCSRCQQRKPYDTDHFVATKHGLSRLCKACNYAQVKEWRARPENKAKRAAEAKRYREKHPDTRQAIVERHRAGNMDRIRELDRAAQVRRRDKDPDGARRRARAYLQRREAEREALAGRSRPEVCDLCGQSGPTVFDHCHHQGHFRGWLCHRCNRVLGSVGDSIELLRKMVAYLEANDGKADSQEAEQAEEQFVRASR